MVLDISLFVDGGVESYSRWRGKGSKSLRALGIPRRDKQDLIPERCLSSIQVNILNSRRYIKRVHITYPGNIPSIRKSCHYEISSFLERGEMAASP